ncbi:MAG: hypothetical protein HY978_04465 [Candidatus Liptonbacteria bacterium]|nr:hypothetical protein [Candidatus Liptonbacteria bacterium]
MSYTIRRGLFLLARESDPLAEFSEPEIVPVRGEREADLISRIGYPGYRTEVELGFGVRIFFGRKAEGWRFFREEDGAKAYIVSRGIDLLRGERSSPACRR